MDNIRSLSQALRSSSDEAIVNQVAGMAGERSGNAKRLVQLSRDIGPENMRMLGAHVLDQAGGAGEWSAARFSTAIGKLSDTAKSVLFGPARQQVEDLHGIATRWASQEAQFANRSNTGRATLLGYGAGVVTAAMVNPLLVVGKVLAGVGGGVTLGMVLSQPVTAKAAVRVARAAERLSREDTQAARNAFNASQRIFLTTITSHFGSGRQSSSPPEGRQPPPVIGTPP
jgi:hypothetical protein